jgi:hypothetical protein
MGDYTDMMLDGIYCCVCGGLVTGDIKDDPPGHPIVCEECQLAQEEQGGSDGGVEGR